MKRLLFMVAAACLLLTPLPMKTAASTDVSQQFLQELDNRLEQEISYYHEGSVKVLDALTMDGEVTKTISTDDPVTEENEEKVETYQSNFTIALVEFQEKRDGFIYYDKTELYFWDNENNEFLTFSNIAKNERASDFFENYSESLHKEMQLTSLIIFMIMLSIVIAVPVLITLFFAPARSTFTKTPFYHNQLNL